MRTVQYGRNIPMDVGPIFIPDLISLLLGASSEYECKHYYKRRLCAMKLSVFSGSVFWLEYLVLWFVIVVFVFIFRASTKQKRN